jgi:transcriptional regulator with XRE-family HTH domain
MLSFLPKKPTDTMEELKLKFKVQRKSLGYTQTELSTRSGVSLGSLKRFEGNGQISLESLLKLAFVLECLADFEKICEPKEVIPKSIEDLI